MATGLGALSDDQVHPGGHMALGVLGLAGQSADETPLLVGSIQHVRRWWPQGVHHKSGTVRQGDVELWCSALGGERRTGFGRQPATGAFIIG